jgi:HEAT repeat protein
MCSLFFASALWGQNTPATNEPAASLVEQFKSEPVFWKQFEIAQKIVALHDSRVLHELERWLSNKDMRARGNAAFVFAKFGDDRGFQTIRSILEDCSAEREVAARDDAGRPSARRQTREDRYYAAHLFGDLKDRRAVPILIPYLNDEDVNYIVPWALGEIGDKSAVPALVGALSNESPDARVLAIYALEELKAKDALPQIRALLNDNERTHFDGLVTVGQAAEGAVRKLE